MTTSRFIAISLAALFAVIVRCSQPTAGVGAGGETTNGRVTGLVKSGDGLCVRAAEVQLFPVDYDPVKDTAVIQSVTTNAQGRYVFSSVAPGRYNVLAVKAGNGTKALVNGILVAEDTVAASICILGVPGTIRVQQPSGSDGNTGYFYIPGTGIFAFLNNNNEFVSLDSLPAGTIQAVSYSSTQNVASTVIRYDVRVNPGEITVVRNPSWKYAQRLFLNTTASGANIAGMVNNFPVLVRLTDENFVFQQAAADGGDLRFIKADGSPLSYELVRWDAARGIADAWVKVDTILGNNGTQYILMLWGDSAASSESSGPAVFHPSGGFEGVWHLGETSGTRAYDASHNGFAGTYMGGLPANIDGPLGIGQNIVRPDSDYVELGNVLNLDRKNITIGVWMKRGALSTTQQALVAKTKGNAPSPGYGYLLTLEVSDLPRFYMASGGSNWDGGDSTFSVMSNLAINDSVTWHQVVVVVDRSDNALCRMYIDGIDRTAATKGDVTLVSNVTNTNGLHLGTESDNNCSFTGAIGEVTISFAARSADWVKLSYMNQKAGDRLVVFGKD